MGVTIRLLLKEFFAANKLRPLHVEAAAIKQLGLPLGENTIYRMMKNPEPQKIDAVTLDSILRGSSYLLGRPVKIEELVTFIDIETEAQK